MKRKLLAIALALVMLVTLFVPTVVVSAADGPALTIELGEITLIEDRNETDRVLAVPVLLSENVGELYVIRFQVVSTSGLTPYVNEDWWDYGWDEGDFTQPLAGGRYTAKLNNTVNSDLVLDGNCGFQVVQDVIGAPSGDMGITTASGTLITLYFNAPTELGNYDFEVIWLDGADNTKAMYTATVGGTVSYTVSCTDHVWDDGVVAEGVKCGETADVTYTCTMCGETKVEIGDLVEHNVVDDEANSIAPTCTETGIEAKKCDRAGCDYTETTQIPATGHSYDDTNDSDCNNCGEVRDVNAPQIHLSLGTPVLVDRNGDSVIKLPVLMSNNTGELYAIRYQVVSNNGLVPYINEDIWDYGYDEGDVIQKYGALSAYLANTVNGDLILDNGDKGFQVLQDVVGGPAGRGITNASGTLITLYFVAPTVSGDYSFELIWMDASDNSKVMYSGTAGAPVTYNVHVHSTEGFEETKAATCTEDGLMTAYCTVCDAAVATEEIPATGHTQGEFVETTAPTCTEVGEKTAYCTVCEEALATEAIPATGHSYTLNSNHTCDICKHSKTPDAPVLEKKTANSVVLIETEGFEYSIDGINWQDSGIFSELEMGTEYTFYQRVKASEIANVSEASEALTVETDSYKLGDLNHDGLVDTSDLSLMKLVLADLRELDENGQLAADLVPDGTVDTSDLSKLKLVLAGLATLG